MTEPGALPLGPPPRDPTAPARLLDAAAEVGLLVERLHRDVDRLQHAIDILASEVSPGSGRVTPMPRRDITRTAPESSQPSDIEARTLAADLAAERLPRDAILEGVRLRFGMSGVEDVLQALFAAAEPAQRPQDPP